MEEEFYKTIKTIIENPPEFPYQDAHWKALKLRLNQRDNDNVKLNWWKKFWRFFFDKK